MRHCWNYIHPDSCLAQSPEPLERLRPAERASYKTHHGAEGDQPHGCMEDTRVQIIADLEAWAQNETGLKVYWLYGYLGIGKTSIVHTLSDGMAIEDVFLDLMAVEGGIENTESRESSGWASEGKKIVVSFFLF